MSILNTTIADHKLMLVVRAVQNGTFAKNSRGGIMFFTGDDAKEKLAAYKRKQKKCRKAKEGKQSV